MSSSIESKPREHSLSSDSRRDEGGLFGLTGWRKWFAFWAGWTALGLFEAVRIYFNFPHTSWTKPILWGMTDLYMWGAISLLVYRVAFKLGLDRKRWVRSIVIHLGLAIVFALAQIYLDSAAFFAYDRVFFHAMDPAKATVWGIYLNFLKEMLHTAILIYLLIAFVCHAMIYYRQYRDEELRRAEMQSRLAQARLDSLKMQIHPHFLFNTLNSIAALIHIDPQAADRMIARLSDLLRMTLEAGGAQTVPLREEIEFLNRYLDIQKIRFQERLRVEIELDREAPSAHVPSLILQPLVENAIRHGINPCPSGGDLKISAKRAGENLTIEIANTGAVGTSTDIRSGRGLTLTRERLSHLYGTHHTFSIQNGLNPEFVVAITLPFSTSAPSDGQGAAR